MKRQYHRTFHNTRPQAPVPRKPPREFTITPFANTVPDFQHVTKGQFDEFWQAIGRWDYSRANEILSGLSDEAMREIDRLRGGA